MDKFEIKLNNGTYLSVYRGIYTPVNSNMFVILIKNNAIVVDPNEKDELLDLFSHNGIEHVYILLTHEHYDHISGVCWLQKHFVCTIICNADCVSGLEKQGKDFPRLVALVLADKDKKMGDIGMRISNGPLNHST